MTQTYEIAVNARPDKNGRLWLYVFGTTDHQSYSARIGRYMVANGLARESTTDETEAYASFPASVGLTCILRTCSEFFTGNHHQVVFDRINEDHFFSAAAADDANDTGPAMFFRIWKSPPVRSF